MSKNKEDVGNIVEVKVKLSAALLLGLIGAATTFVYFFFPQTQAIFNFMIPLLGGLVAVYAAYYLAMTLKVGIQREKIHRSFEIASAFNDIDSASIRTFIQKELSGKDLSPADFHKKIVEEHDINTSIKSMLGLFEDASIAIQTGYADEMFLFRSLVFLVKYNFKTLYPYIEVEKEEDKSLYCELERLADSWKTNTLLTTGEKIDLYNHKI